MFNLFNFGDEKTNSIIIKSPFNGTIIPIEETPDPVFSQKMVGDGFAIEPTDEYLQAPVQGEIIQLFSTHHALGIKTPEGLEVLIHLGIDTVELAGAGFKALVEEGEKIQVGDKLIEIDWRLIAKRGKSKISPVVITNMKSVEKIKFHANGPIMAGEDVLEVIIKK